AELQADGGDVIQWTCNEAENQQLEFQRVAGTTDVYNIVFQHSEKCMEIEGASLVAGTIIHQWECNGSTNQQFRVIPNGTAFSIINLNSGMAIEVPNDSLAPSPIVQGVDTGAAYQTFNLPGYL
ncbi:MAG: RICIN domain-containing protein, partial [Myxococcota bacterium]